MRRILAALCGVALALLVTATPAQAAPGRLYNTLSHKCLTIAGGDTAPGATAVQFTCDTHQSRYWTLVGDLEGQFQLRNANSGRCLAPSGVGPNAVVVQQACAGTAVTTWYRFPGTPAGVHLKNLYTGLCLTPAGGSQGDNVAIVQYYCDGHISRGWYS